MRLAFRFAVIARKRPIVGCLHLLKKTESPLARSPAGRILHLLYHRQSDLTDRVFRQVLAYAGWTTVFDQRTNLRHCLSNILVPRVRQRRDAILFSAH